MKLQSFVFLFLFSMTAVAVTGQQYNRDSIHQVIDNIRKMPLDTTQLIRLRELGYNLIETDSALAKQLLQEAIDKSFVLKDQDAITNSLRLLGIWYSYFGNTDKALELHRASLQSASRNQNLYLMAGAYFNIGNVKYWKGQYDSCIEYYLKTARLYDDPGIYKNRDLTQRIMDKKKSDLYYNMSAVFNTLKNLPKADEYINKAISIAEGYKSAPSIAFYVQQKADNYSQNGEPEKGLRIRLAHLQQLADESIPKTYLQEAYQHIAKDYFDLEKTDSSKIFAEKGLALSEELHVRDGVANANWQLGRIALKEKRFADAEKYLGKCGDYFLRSEDPIDQRDYFDAMRRLMFAIGKYKEGYLYFEKYEAVNDTILKSERSLQFSEREARYQSEKKDTQIQLQQVSIKQKNTLNYVLAGAALAAMIIGVLVLRNYRQKQIIQQQRINDLETEKQLTATEAVLKGEEQERTRLAKDLHDGLGGMLSGIKYSLNTMKGNLVMTPNDAQAFERSIDMLDSSIKEMRRVAHNMMPEALVKFGLDAALKDFCNDINQSGVLKITYQSIKVQDMVIDQTMAITIYRIVQELINNTIKHAAAGHAIVQLSRTDDGLNITVEDDGKGFDTSLLKSVKGIGWSNIQNRIEFLKGRLDVNSQPGKGTSVLIELKA